MNARVMRRLFLLASIVCAAGAFAPGADAPADHILTNGRDWTAVAERPWAEAVAIRGSRIAYVGSTAGAEALRGPKTDRIDLGGRFAMPGFNDSHIHLMSGALSLERVDLIEEQSLEALQARIRSFAAANPASSWVLGRGWLYGSFPGGLPTRSQLDAVLAVRPPNKKW
jgi:predicted amidohydrolase YtcJ